MPNPTITVVKEGLGVFQNSGADYLIAIGGGSPQDTCKAIGIISNNPEFADVRSLEGLSPTNKPSVPILAIPTTAGTAAEVTINYDKSGVKSRFLVLLLKNYTNIALTRLTQVCPKAFYQLDIAFFALS